MQACIIVLMYDDGELKRLAAVRVDVFRRLAGLTLHQLAGQTGLSTGSASNVVTGRISGGFMDGTLLSLFSWSGGFVRLPHWGEHVSDTPKLREELQRAALRSRRVRAAIRRAEKAGLSAA